MTDNLATNITLHSIKQATEHNAKRQALVKVPIGLELRIMRHMWEVAGYNAYRLYFNSDSFCAL